MNPSYHLDHTSSRNAFTLIELLVVIAVVGILSIVVLLTINPAELLRQSRDVNRLSDIDTLNHALNIYQADMTVNPSFGNGSTTYISVADPLATSTTGSNCAGLSLNTSTLPSGWTFHCAASSTLKNVDGTGWVPVNFTAMSIGSPLGTLPVDPVNTTSSNDYYTYTPGGSWELTSLFESQKYIPRAAKDGGVDPMMYETGTNLALAPFARGLVGYWNFDEGSGTTVRDGSGFSNNGTLNNSPAWTTTNCKTGNCLSFTPASSQYVRINSPVSVGNGCNESIVMWSYRNTGDSLNSAMFNGAPSLGYANMDNTGGNYFRFEMYLNSGADVSTGGIAGQWIQSALVLNQGVATGYINNNQSYVLNNGVNTGCLVLGAPYVGTFNPGGPFFNGLIDEVRIYNRALSASEIQAMYTATR